MDWNQVFSIVLGAGIGLGGSMIATRRDERWRKQRETLQRLHEQILPDASKELAEKWSPVNLLDETIRPGDMKTVREIYRLEVYLPRGVALHVQRLLLDDISRSLVHQQLLAEGIITRETIMGSGLPTYDQACEAVQESLSDISQAVRESLRPKQRFRRLRRAWRWLSKAWR